MNKPRLYLDFGKGYEKLQAEYWYYYNVDDAC